MLNVRVFESQIQELQFFRFKTIYTAKLWAIFLKSFFRYIGNKTFHFFLWFLTYMMNYFFNRLNIILTFILSRKKGVSKNFLRRKLSAILVVYSWCQKKIINSYNVHILGDDLSHTLKAKKKSRQAKIQVKDKQCSSFKSFFRL